MVVLMSLEKESNPGEAVNFWLHPTRKHGNTQREKEHKDRKITERKEERRGERKEGRERGKERRLDVTSQKTKVSLF